MGGTAPCYTPTSTEQHKTHIPPKQQQTERINIISFKMTGYNFVFQNYAYEYTKKFQISVLR